MNFLKTDIEKPLSLLSCGHFISTVDWTHTKRTIDSYEIIIGINGTVFIQQDNEKFEVTPSNVLLLLPGHMHQGYAISKKGTSFFWLHFYPNETAKLLDYESALFEASTYFTNPYLNKVNRSIVIPVFSTPTDIGKILIQFKQLLHIANSNYYTPLAGDYFLTSTLIELSQQSIIEDFKGMDNLNIKNSRFISMLEWIRINIDKNITVEILAEEFNFNKDYLTRLFKKHLGVGIKEYINSIKISNAKELLCQTDHTIKEIAYTLGFEDEKYFMKLFKLHECLTPSQFRNAYFNTHLNSK